MSKNKVEVKINGKEYTIIGVESEEYIQKVALYIDKKMNEIYSGNNRLSTAMTAVLTAINVADDYFKSYENADHLRVQVQQYISELDKNNTEKEEYKRENEKLKNTIHALQLEIAKKEKELEDFINNFDQSPRNNTVPIDSARRARAK